MLNPKVHNFLGIGNSVPGDVKTRHLALHLVCYAPWAETLEFPWSYLGKSEAVFNVLAVKALQILYYNKMLTRLIFSEQESKAISNGSLLNKC